MKIGFNPNFCGLIKCYNQNTKEKVTINTNKIQKIEEQKNNCCRILTSEKSRPQYPVGYFIVKVVLMMLLQATIKHVII